MLLESKSDTKIRMIRTTKFRKQWKGPSQLQIVRHLSKAKPHLRNSAATIRELKWSYKK